MKRNSLNSLTIASIIVLVLSGGLILSQAVFSKVSEGSVMALWHMNGNSNDSACQVNGTDTDIVYSANDGILHEGASFNGNSSKIDFGNNFDMTGAEPRSWTFWFKPSLESGINYIFAKGTDVHQTHTAHGYWLTQVSDRLYWTLNAGEGYGTNEIQMQTGSVVPSTSTWYFIAVTYDGSKSASGVHVYVNTVDETMQVDQNSLSDSATNSDDFVIGTASDGTRPNQMNIDEFAIFNNVISTSTINDLYHNGKGQEMKVKSCAG